MADSQHSELLGVGIAAVLAIFCWGDSTSVRALLAAVAGVIALIIVCPQRHAPLQAKSAAKEDPSAKPSCLVTTGALSERLGSISVACEEVAALTSFQMLSRCLAAFVISCTVRALDIPGYPWNCLLLGALYSWSLRRFHSVPQGQHLLHKENICGGSKLRDADGPQHAGFRAGLANIQKAEDGHAVCEFEDTHKMVASMREKEDCKHSPLAEKSVKEDSPEQSEGDDDDAGSGDPADPFEMRETEGILDNASGQDLDVADFATKPFSKQLSIKAPEYVPRWARKDEVDSQPLSCKPTEELEGEVTGTRRPWRAPASGNAAQLTKTGTCSTQLSGCNEQQESLQVSPTAKLPPWKRAACKLPAADEDDEDICSDTRSTSTFLKQSTTSSGTTESSDGASTHNSDVISEDSAEEEAVDDISRRDASSCDPAEELPEIPVFDVAELLKWRSAVSDEEVKGHELPGRLTAWAELPAVPILLVTSEAKDRHESSSVAPTHGEDMKLQVSENSWAAKRRARQSQRVQSDGPDTRTDEEVLRAVKAILNKLTIEKFPQLYQQMISCGIRTVGHLQQLIQEVFQKATTQHHFIDMYADLCAQLHAHFAKNPIMDDPNMNFKRILLTVCQTSFENNLSPPADLASLSLEERTEAELEYKMRMIGNIRFVGALLVRKMLASKVMLKIASELLKVATPEAHETLAALLTVIGAEFDTPTFMHHVALNAIFCQVQGLAKQSCTPPRVRCLLNDVLDLRASGWLDKKPKKMEKPTTLEEVHQKAAIEADASMGASPSRCSFGQWSPVYQKSAPLSFGSVSIARRGLPVDAVQDGRPKQERVYRDACQAKLVRTFAELFLTHDMEEAMSRIADIGIPASHQVSKLCDMLAIVCEEGNPEKRKVGFRFIAALFLGGHWKPAALAEGLKSFVRGTCVDLKVQVPVLPWIRREELRTALLPTVQTGILNAAQHESLAMPLV